jgi:type III restriction enzyme
MFRQLERRIEHKLHAEKERENARAGDITMKLKFKNQEFQTRAVEAVVDVFKGQTAMQSQYGVAALGVYGYGNTLALTDEAILKNMQDVQKRNWLPVSDDLRGRNYCVEMETGTGKTYVYTKTIFELNKQCGFTKFIIVVPSVAIREGVYKSLQVTADHFAEQYDNVPYRYFIYDSKKVTDARDYAISNEIQIMIINIDAFKKEANIFNRDHDKRGGESAMTYIQNTNPIVIIDEPQSVDNTDIAKSAIANLNPLCVLRYSATHREKINLLYRLTPVDAFQNGLVKQIWVSCNTVANDFNKPYFLHSRYKAKSMKTRIKPCFSVTYHSLNSHIVA